MSGRCKSSRRRTLPDVLNRAPPWFSLECVNNLRQLLTIRVRAVMILVLGVWRSPVAHLVWDQGVQGSNPCTPTSISYAGRHYYRRPVISLPLDLYFVVCRCLSLFVVVPLLALPSIQNVWTTWFRTPNFYAQFFRLSLCGVLRRLRVGFLRNCKRRGDRACAKPSSRFLRSNIISLPYCS